MRNLGTQHCLTSDDDANYRQKDAREKKKKRDEREFKSEEVFTQQYLVSSTRIVIYKIQVLEKQRKKKERRHGKVSTKKLLRLSFENMGR